MSTYAAIVLLLLLIWSGFRFFRSVRQIRLCYIWICRLLFFPNTGLFLLYPVWGLLQYWFLGYYDRSGFPVLVIYLFWYALGFTLTPVRYNAPVQVTVKEVRERLFLPYDFNRL